jgi:uncharacterized phage protein (TIGR01671 family)
MRTFNFRIWARAWKPPRMVRLSEIELFSQEDAQQVFDYVNDGLFTLLQGTGCKDQGGFEIFEGDIILFKPFGVVDERYGVRVGVVEYNDRNATFVLVIYDNYKTKTVRGHETLFHSENKFKIIGNIFENAKLLE